MRIARFLLPLSVLGLVSPIAMADPCVEVVDDTVAEMKAGAGGAWSAELETLVRRAAGSACVKASSGRYQGLQAVVSEPMPVAKAQSADVSAAQSEAGAEGAAVQEKTDSVEVQEDGSWSMGGLTFRGLSGSPAKKTYQRQREQEEEKEN